jgi:hypothetical protein
MNEVSGHLHRLSREEKQAKQRATHKQEEERIKLDDIQFFNNNYLNKKQELPVAAMFVNQSGQNEQSVFECKYK